MAVGIEGLDVERMTSGETIGFGGSHARILGRCILRPSGVYMGVAKEGSTKRCVLRTGFPIFGHRIGTVFCACEPGRERENEKENQTGDK